MEIKGIDVSSEHKNPNSNVLFANSSKDYYMPLVMEIKNSTVILTKLKGLTIFENTNPEPMKIKVLEGGNLKFIAPALDNPTWPFVSKNTNQKIEIYLSGTENNPAQISMTILDNLELRDPKKMLTIITSNLNDRFTLNGKTYQPVVLGSTLLQEFETSPNWKLVSDN